MKCLASRLPTLVEHCVTAAAKGVKAARKAGGVIAELPGSVSDPPGAGIQFQVEVIDDLDGFEGLNGIERKVTQTQEGESVTEQVAPAHVIEREDGQQVTVTEKDANKVTSEATSKKEDSEVTTNEENQRKTDQNQNTGTSGSDKVITTYEYE